MGATHAENKGDVTEEPLKNYSDMVRSISPMDNYIPATLSPEDFEKTIAIYAFEPKANCNKCYGRGQRGVNTQTGNYVLCKCVRKKMMAGVMEEADGD